MTRDAVLNQLGLLPNAALLVQLENIEKNTHGYEKIIKHILDLHEALKTSESYVALSKSEDYFKIKIGATSYKDKASAMEQLNQFCEKYKVEVRKVKGQFTYYILCYSK